jgi:hypothetical protein
MCDAYKPTQKLDLAMQFSIWCEFIQRVLWLDAR